MLAEWRVSDLKALNYYNLKTCYCRRYVTSCNLTVLNYIIVMVLFGKKKKVSIKLQLKPLVM